MKKHTQTAKTALSILLAVLLMAAPALVALADNAAAEDAAREVERSFLQAIGDTYDHLRRDILELIPGYQTRGIMNLFSYTPRHKQPTGELVTAELTEAFQALNDFSASVLKDDMLAEALDEIIWDLMEVENFTEGVQDRKEFVSDIIRDERLILILGEVIAGYLGDEQLAEDIELFFDIFLDLIADDNLQDYIKETIARLLEDESTAALLDGILSAGAQIAYETSTGVIADVTADDRIKEILKEITAIFIEPVPDMIADLIEDESVQAISHDITLILLEYGPELTADILEDERFQTLFSDMMIVTFELASRTVTGTMRDERLTGLIGTVFTNVADAFAGQTFAESVETMVDDFFKCEEFRSFVDPSFAYLIDESQYRALKNTPEDSFILPPMFELEINLMKEMAWEIAAVPPDIVNLAAFNWLVYGHEDIDGTFSQWAVDLVNVITPEMILAVGAAMADMVSNAVPRLIDDNNLLLFEELKGIMRDLPFEESAEFIREDESLGELPGIIAERILYNIPFEKLAKTFREDEEVATVLQDVLGELIDEFPLDKVGEFISQDPRISGLIHDAVPGLPMRNLANLIREDERITDIITEIAGGFPVTAISRFLQEEVRADIIGHTIADLLLNLVADFIENEMLSDFIYSVLEDVMLSFDEPVAKIILDNMARIYENDEVAPFLAGSLVGFAGEIQPEVYAIYREVVPKFFTRIITGAG